MRSLLLFLLLVVTPMTYSQPNFEWANQMGGSGVDLGQQLTLDVFGNVYATGSFEGTVDFDPSPSTFNLTSSGNRDIFVSKTDAAGNFVWARQFGGSGYDIGNSIVHDASGSVFITGTFESSVDFDPGPGVFALSSAGGRDIFIEKLDDSGNFLWARRFGGTISDNGFAIGLDAGGNAYTTGSFFGTVDFDPGVGTFNLTSLGSSTDLFISKLDAVGNFVWAKRFGGTSSENIYSIKLDDLGNIYLTGLYTSTVDFDPGPGNFNLTSSGNADIFISKLSDSGNFIWAKSIGGVNNDIGYSIEDDDFGNIFIAGTFLGTVDFDPGPGLSNLNSISSFNNDAFVAKLDTSGAFIWAKQFGSPNASHVNSVFTDNFGNVYCAGSFAGSVDCDPGVGNINLTSAGYSDVFIVKLDGLGNFVWNTQYGGNGNDKGSFINIDLVGNIYTIGSFQGTVDFDHGIGTFNHSSLGGSDIFIHKMNQCVSNSGTDVQTACTNFEWIDGNTYTSSTNSPTFTLTNITGCDSVVTLNLTIGDFNSPTPDNLSLSNVTSQCSITSLSAPTATDNCVGTITGTHNATLPITAQGTTVVTWTYDDGNGNTATQTQNVIIDDVTSPVADVTNLLVITSECEVTSLSAPTATDNCAGTITGIHNVVLPITTQGTTVVTWTYDDGNGNTSTQTQNVIIDDVTSPIADASNLLDITSECEVTSLSAPTATDYCAGTITGTHNAVLPITTPGSTVVTWTYDDGNGNTSTQTQNVIIDDVTTPIADAVNLSDITSECEVSTLTAPTATDNCAGTIAGTHNATLPITNLGTTVVTWTYDDGNGNTSTQTQNVIITPIDNGITQVDAVTLSADLTGYNYQWIDCDNGNQPINGATNQTFTAIANGNYAVEIDNGTCTVVSACMVIDEVGIKEIWDTDLVKIYPNPTTGTLNIESTVDIQSIELMDALGQLIKIYNANENKIEINTAPGVYFLRITAGGRENNIPVVKH